MGTFLVSITSKRMCMGVWGSGVVDIIILAYFSIISLWFQSINQLILKTYCIFLPSGQLIYRHKTVMAL
jgi:hypothetical protein